MEQETNSISNKENTKAGIGKKILYGTFSALFLGLTSATLLIIFLQKFIKDENSIGMLSFISIILGLMVFFIVGYRYSMSVESGVVKVYTEGFPVKEGELRKKMSLAWGLAFVTLIVIIPGILSLTKYIAFAPYFFAGGFFIFLISMAIKFRKPYETKIKLGIFESIVVILWVLTALILYTLGKDTTVLLQLQKTILFVWIILSGMWLYRKARLFGGADENFVVSSSDILTTGQKIAIALSSIIFAPLVGIITLFLWKKSSLTKARKANLISMVVFILEAVLVFVILAVTQK